MSINVQLKTINCPTCGDKLRYETEGETVVCMSCGNSITITKNTNSQTQEIAKKSKVGEIKKSSTALAYIEQFLEDYDWEAFAFDYDFTIDELDELVDNLKITAADDYRTWIAAFVCLVVPFSKKVEYRKKSLEKIIEEYKDKNLDAYAMYDAYKRVARAIIAKYSQVKEQAEKILGYAKKYGVDQDTLDKCESISAELNVNQIKNTIFDSIESVPGIIKIQKAEQDALVKKLAEEGIDAEALYAEALQDKEEKRYKQALGKFLRVNGYKDAEKQVKEMENSFLFANVLSVKDNLYYIHKASNYNVSELLQIKGQKVQNKPLVKGILKIVATYANSVYFLENASGAIALSVYDFEEKTKSVICKSLTVKTQFKFDLQRQTLFFLKEKGDVLQKEYELFKVNIIDNSLGSCLKGMNKVVGFSDNDYFIFEESALVEEKRKTTTKIYEVETGKIYNLEKNNVTICGFIDGDVIFTSESPDAYNKDLYKATLAEKINPVLLEPNISGQCAIFNKKIYYYTLDNSNTKFLISINSDGSNRTELSKYVKEILFVSGKWIYFIKSYRYNSALYRMTTDGKKGQLIATQIEKFVRIEGGYMYYIDHSRKVHKVRMDGSRDTVLCSNVEKVLAIKDERIVFVSPDKVVRTVLGLNGISTKEYNKSIYAIDFDASGRRKAVYDIFESESFDSEKAYFTKKITKKDAPMASVIELYQLNFNDYSIHRIAELKAPPVKTGCYVATCVYGSYDCPEVWTLRRYRDDVLGSTWYGRAFIRLYYAISPTFVKWFGKTKWFKKMWKGKLDRMVKHLQDKGVENTPYEDKDWVQ